MLTGVVRAAVFLIAVFHVSAEVTESISEPVESLMLPLTEKTQTGYLVRKDVSQYLINEIDNAGYTKIAEFGPGGIDRRFPRANILIDHFERELQDIPEGITTYQLDIDLDRLPVEDNGFDFVYCRHVLEDINNPAGAFREMTRLSKRGYIETPSPLIESVVMDHFSLGIPGYPHHRFLFWTDVATNTLYALQKFPMINVVHRPSYQVKQWIQVLTDYPHMFNNYYQWDVDLGLMPQIVMLKHDVDFKIQAPHTYGELIERGAQLSVNHTIAFFETYINPFVELEG